jgi:hypothetical protein
MITDDLQLAAALHMMAWHADALEGLRLHAQATGDATLLPTLSGGHVAKLRELIAEADAYVNTPPDVARTGEVRPQENGQGIATAEDDRVTVLAADDMMTETEKAAR